MACGATDATTRTLGAATKLLVRADAAACIVLAAHTMQVSSLWSPACRVPGADLMVKNVHLDQNIAQSFQCLSKFAWSVTIPVQRLQW